MPHQAYGPPQPIVVIAPKSPGIAVLLSILWLGAGHLYVGKIASGVILMIFDMILFLLAFTLIGAIIAIPVWLVSVIIVSILAATAASATSMRALGPQPYR